MEEQDSWQPALAGEEADPCSWQQAEALRITRGPCTFTLVPGAYKMTDNIC